MTPSTLDALASRAGGYVAAAQLEADIANQFEGLDDPDTDALATHHRTLSLALLARACAQMTPTVARTH